MPMDVPVGPRDAVPSSGLPMDEPAAPVEKLPTSGLLALVRVGKAEALPRGLPRPKPGKLLAFGTSADPTALKRPGKRPDADAVVVPVPVPSTCAAGAARMVVAKEVKMMVVFIVTRLIGCLSFG